MGHVRASTFLVILLTNGNRQLVVPPGACLLLQESRAGEPCREPHILGIEKRAMGLQWQQTWQQSQINIYWHTAGGESYCHSRAEPRQDLRCWMPKARRSSSDTKWCKADGRAGWRTTAQLFLASIHSCARVLLSGIAGVLFLQQFFWKAAFCSPVGVSHIPTAGWHTAGICILIFCAG